MQTNGEKELDGFDLILRQAGPTILVTNLINMAHGSGDGCLVT